MVLLDWPPPDHLWIGRRSRQFAPSQRLTNVPELRTPNAAAQTRTVSGGAFWPSRGESSRHFKYMARAGRVGVKRFQTAAGTSREFPQNYEKLFLLVFNADLATALG